MSVHFPIYYIFKESDLLVGEIDQTERRVHIMIARSKKPNKKKIRFCYRLSLLVSPLCLPLGGNSLSLACSCSLSSTMVPVLFLALFPQLAGLCTSAFYGRAGEARASAVPQPLTAVPSPPVLPGQAQGCREGIFSSPRRRAAAWHQPGWLLAARPRSTACPAPLAPVPGAAPVTAPAPACWRRTRPNCGNKWLRAHGLHCAQGKSQGKPCHSPPLFWQPWWVSARVGNLGPCLSPVAGPGAPDTLWLSSAFIDSYSGLGAGSEYCSHKEHTFLWVYPSDFTVSSMTGIVIPASLVWWAPGIHLLAQGRWAPAFFNSPGWRFSPLFGSQEQCLTARIFSWNQGFSRCYGHLLVLNCPFQRSWTQAVKHTLCIFEINEASFACDTDGQIFGSAEHLWLLPHSLRTCWHAELWKIRPCFSSAKGLLMCGI